MQRVHRHAVGAIGNKDFTGLQRLLTGFRRQEANAQDVEPLSWVAGRPPATAPNNSSGAPEMEAEALSAPK